MAGEGRRALRAYWAAWGEIFELAGEIMQFAVKPILLPAAAILALTSFIAGECIMLADGEYWQAALVFFGSIVCGLIGGGHFAALMIMKENESEQEGGGDGG